MFAEKDLFVDDGDDDNHLDFLRQIRKEKASEPYRQNRVEQDLQIENEDDDFTDHFNKLKNQEEEKPKNLDDLFNDNDTPINKNMFAGNRLSKGPKTTQSRANIGRGGQNIDNFLYESTVSVNVNQPNEDGPLFQASQLGNVYSNDSWANDQSRPGTSNGRPMTSTSMNARARLAQQQKARLGQSQTNNGEGTLVSNNMLRASKTGNLYQNSNYNFEKKNQGNEIFYDPTLKNMDKTGLPELQKTNHVISYQVKDRYASDDRVEEQHQPEPEPVKYKQPSPREEYQPLESHNRLMDSTVNHEEEKEVAPSDTTQQEKDSSDEEPTKEEMKALAQQKKELAKQPDAEVGFVTTPDAAANGAGVSKVLRIDVTKIADMKSFLTKPCPKGYRIECTIKRDKSGMARFYPKYHCYFSNGPQYIMSGRKRGQNKTSNYLISYNKNDIKKNSPFSLGKLRSNFMGTEFNIFNEGLNPGKSTNIEKLRENLGVILYESNLLSAKGPRKMKILLPQVDENTNEPYQFKPLSEKDGLLGCWKDGRKKGIKEFQNKNPKWNDQLQAFVLNFNGRVEKPSVKNFQLIDEKNDEKIFLQFGRVTNDTFNMDFEWPLSPMQAFAICLSSFDYKIACE